MESSLLLITTLLITMMVEVVREASEPRRIDFPLPVIRTVKSSPIKLAVTATADSTVVKFAVSFSNNILGSVRDGSIGGYR